MDAKVIIRRHAQPDGAPVASVTTSTGRVLRVVGMANDPDCSSADVVDVMKSWITWERRGRP